MSRDSKFLSMVLRHEPEKIGATLDANGWILIEDLLRLLKRVGRTISLQQLEKIVETNDKRRFTISEVGLQIRAAQGHSIDIDLQPLEPPTWLFHGTARDNLDVLFKEGLR